MCDMQYHAADTGCRYCSQWFNSKVFNWCGRKRDKGHFQKGWFPPSFFFCITQICNLDTSARRRNWFQMAFLSIWSHVDVVSKWYIPDPKACWASLVNMLTGLQHCTTHHFDMHVDGRGTTCPPLPPWTGLLIGFLWHESIWSCFSSTCSLFTICRQQSGRGSAVEREESGSLEYLPEDALGLLFSLCTSSSVSLYIFKKWWTGNEVG